MTGRLERSTRADPSGRLWSFHVDTIRAEDSMPRRSLPLLAVLLVVGLAHGQSKKPTKYTPIPATAGLGFSASFPCSVADSTKELATAAGSVTVRTHRGEYEKVAYAVTVTEYPESFADLPPEKILDGVRDGLRGDGEVTKDKATTVNDAPARELEVTTKKKTGVRGIAVLHKRTLYVITAAGPSDSLAKETATDFLKSFALDK